MQRIAPLRFTRRLSDAWRARCRVDTPICAVDFEPRLRTRLLVLQPTPFCNIDCDYCYLPDRNNRARMSIATVRQVAERLVDDDLVADSLTVVWHAGEPLVLPPAYYEEAFRAFREALPAGTVVSHSMQTNATLIDDDWCRLFVEHGVRVGVSVDGPAFVHDAHRRTRAGKGTHQRVVRGLETLRRNGVAFHAIAVVTADALRHADAIHAFFVATEIHEIGFNFDEAEGCHGASSISGREHAHRAFLERMLAHMHASGGEYQVRELVHAYQVIARGAPRYRWRGELLPDNPQTIPFAIVSVAWDGRFSTFSPELLGQPSVEFQDFFLGNVAGTGYLASTGSDLFDRLWSAVRSGDRSCRERCAYFDYCGGGSPANKLYENGSLESTETLYCRSMIQRPLDIVLDSIERAAAAAGTAAPSQPACSRRPNIEPATPINTGT